MDKSIASNLAKNYIPNEKDSLSINNNNKLIISSEAANLTDTNKDGLISQKELISGLESDKVIIDTKNNSLEKNSVKEISTINKITFFSNDDTEKERTPESFRNDVNGKQWFQQVFNPDIANPDSPYKGIKGTDVSSLKGYNAQYLVGQSFEMALNFVKNPYDVAVLLDKGITYDYERAPTGSYSPRELLELGTGVCRDYHALAASLLKENGYEAKMLAYSSADTSHAFTVYQDPETGKWGAIEYGRVYPPEMLEADSPEEALMKVRPDTIIIREYTDIDSPDSKAIINKIHYTPTSRAFDSFVFSKHSGNVSPVVTNTYAEVGGTFGDGKWEYGVRYHLPDSDLTPTLDNSIMGGVWRDLGYGFRIGIGGGYMPEMFKMTVGPNDKKELPTGFVFGTIEGNHPKLVGVQDIGGSGININLNSKFQGVATLAFNKSGDILNPDGSSKERDVKMGLDTSMMYPLNKFDWTPDITVNREFDLWGNDKKETNLYAKYGMDFDSLVMADFYSSGGKGFPMTHYVQTGVETEFDVLGGLKVGAGVYVPIQTHSNNYSDEVLVNVSASTKYVGISTTQGKNTGIYNVDVGVNLTEGKVDTRLEGFASLEEDRINDTLTPKAGAKVSFKF